MGSADTDRMYMCIDLKSFYASVECADLGVDPFTTPLVVADNSRGKGAITLAISPALKKLGVKNRSRLFQIPSHIEYITVKPHMKRYMQASAQIYGTLLNYISPEDIHVYSIDEYFIDITPYTNLYKKTPRQLAQMCIRDRRIKDWTTIKQNVRDALGKFFYDKTRRRPMILPIIQDVH